MHFTDKPVKRYGKKRKGSASTRPRAGVSSEGVQHSRVRRLLRRSTIGARNDSSEREADRMAERVTAVPGSNVVSRKTPRPKSDGGGAPVLPVEAGALVRSLNGKGQPLSAAERGYFEPRFGTDLSDVRIHNDMRAADRAGSVNARAFTYGNNVVFGAGEYASNTASGRKLLAHELAHVIQQRGGEGARIQRKIKVEPGVSLDGYLITGATKSGNIYTHSGSCESTISNEIISDMLSSPRTFSVKGGDDMTAGSNLGDHVAARKGIVDFAAKKKYKFAAGSAMTMNSTYWRDTGKQWELKPGKNFMMAMKDVNVNPDKYKIACKAATKITMLAGSGDFSLKKDTGAAQDDWVPGDWGYIDNTKFVKGVTRVGLEGENIIYTGYEKFWGHFTGSNTYRSLQDWIKEVNSWNTPTGGASLEGYRKRPSKGLY